MPADLAAIRDAVAARKAMLAEQDTKLLGDGESRGAVVRQAAGPEAGLYRETYGKPRLTQKNIR